MTEGVKKADDEWWNGWRVLQQNKVWTCEEGKGTK
jgi:hypothetical protein